MNQTLTEHHIAQYNILLTEDQTVSQIKHAYPAGHIALVLGYHVSSADNFDFILTWNTIPDCSPNN